MKRTTGILSAMAMIGAAVALAAPAHATGTLTDNGDGSFTTSGLGGASNEYLYICAASIPASSCDGSNDTYTSPVNGTFTVGSSVLGGTGGMTTIAAGTYSIAVGPASGARSGTLSNFAVGTPSGDSSAAAAEGGSAPADIVQQIGMPSAGCSSIDLPLLNWAGVAGGGWGASWAEWPNGGRGGAVCTRTLSYSTSSGAWYIR